MRRRNLYRIIIGALMAVSGLLTVTLSAGETYAGIILLVAGLAFLFTGIARQKRYGGEPESDERSKRIGAYALSYAWLTGVLVITGLYWLDYSGLARLGTRIALALSLIVLVLSAVIYQVVLFRNGDVD